MVIFKNISESNRSRLRAIFLLALLAVCVGIAWVLAEVKKSKIRAGEEIIAKISHEGLDKHWPAKPVLDCYVIFYGSRPTSWYANYRAPAGGGNFVGGSIYETQARPHDALATTSRWILRRDARAGSYVSNIIGVQGFSAGKADVFIELSDDELRIQQSLGQDVFYASTRRPSNYMPEDVSDLAYAMVANQKTTASFRMYFDLSPIDSGRVPFLTVTAEYIGPYTEVAGASQLLVTTSQGGSKSDDVYVIAADGTILLRSVGDALHKRVTLDELKKIFPKAAVYVKALTMSKFPKLPN